MRGLVHKYGGTSVATPEKIRNVAKRIIREKEKGLDMVVVVSAMGKTTDYLVELAGQISQHPDERELDLLLSTGEQVSIALLTMALQEEGYEAISLTGFQAGIKTAGPHTKNKIIDIDIDKVKDYLAEGKIVIVAGFQGMNELGEITTLGRGGSDTTAVALAAKLSFPCHIYTDVEGIYSVDPRLYKPAKKLEVISYEEMMEMASLGAGVMEPRSILIGQKYKVPIYVASSMNQEKGTYIKEYDGTMEERVVTGLSVCDDILMVTISQIPDAAENMALIFDKLAARHVNVDMISQAASFEGLLSVSFTAKVEDRGAVQAVMDELDPQYHVCMESEISKLSVVGMGMRNQSGVSGRLFRILSDHKIPFRQVTTSEISISYAIDRLDKERAVAILSQELNL